MLNNTATQSQEVLIRPWWLEFLENLQKCPQIADAARNSRRLVRYEVRCSCCKEWKCECFYSPFALKKPFAICKTCNTARVRAYREKDPEQTRLKRRAVSAVHYALSTGKLKKQPCEVCGDPKSEAHHDDYTQPLKIRWRCHKHHFLLHPRTKSSLCPIKSHSNA